MVIRKACAFLLICILSLVATAPFGGAPLAAGSEELPAQLDGVFRAAFPANEPGAAVLVSRNGRVLLRQGYGMADLEHGVRMQPDMVFRLGSITKQFTATAVMILAAEGKLWLTDSVTKHLPDYPESGSRITMEHLLTHTSGIPSYTDMPDFMRQNLLDHTVAEMLDVFKDQPLEFEPGTRFAYSNSGYFLLGAIIEAVSGTAYADFIQERVFQPLGMDNSYYGDHARIIPRRVRGYEKEGEDYVNAPYLSMSAPYAAGSLLSTVDDLVRWDAALQGGGLLAREARQRLWTSYRLASGEATGYGYGWMVGQHAGEPVIQHGGGINGFATHILSLPESRIFVAILSNNPYGGTSSGMLGQKAASLTLGEAIDPEPLTLAPAVLERYVGVYEIDADEERVVTLENGRLFTQRTGGARSEAFAAAETEFFYRHSLSRFRFELDRGGKVVAMVMQPWGGEAETARRTDKPVPTGPQEVDLTPAQFDRLVGDYELMPGFVLSVFREEDRLMTQATGQEKVQIIPTSETEFFLKVVDARITFELDAETGRAESIVLHQGGQNVPGQRLQQ